IVSIMLLMLGLSMTFDSMTDVTISNEMENRRLAFANADTGYNAYKNVLRGLDLSTSLKTPTTVSQYITYPSGYVPTDATASSYFSRNPLYPLEAMNVDFENPPTQIGTRTVFGLLTPAAGVDLGGGGRYWVKITDNNDGDGIDEDLATDTDGDSDPTNDLFVDDEDGVDADNDGLDDANGDPMDKVFDTDGIIYMRVMGIQRVGAGQVSAYGGTVKNSVSIIEVKMERDMTLDLSSPFSLYGSSALPASGSNFFAGGGNPTIDGYDHPTWTLPIPSGNHTEVTGGDLAAIDVMYDDSGGNDAEALRDFLYDEIDPHFNNLTGDATDYPVGSRTSTPSLRDATQTVRDDPNEDAENIFDAGYLEGFISKAAAVADITVADGTNINYDLGSEGDPKLTYCVGDCGVGGNDSGVGLLIVRGRFDANAGWEYRGLILVVGSGVNGGVADLSGLNAGIIGGLFVAKTVYDPITQTWSFDVPSFRLSGNTDFYFQGSGLQMAYSLFPMKATVYREITPEIEPPQP
ncbi:hypothetical protein MYX82_10870, partial [Acidobacteria bacterium AH-259-D05]|nr:hypothetical protein [Acidobacteria bacterium AH-259-D05]